MMNDYVILMDATADMIDSLRAQIHVLPMKMTLGAEEILYHADWADAQYHAFYDKLRGGAMGATSQITPYLYEEAVKTLFDRGQDVLYLCFSSALSNTIQSARVAQSALGEKYPERKLVIVDLLSATYSEGMMLEDALKNRAAGLSIEENAAWIKAHRMDYACYCTVENLIHLARGGRLPLASAILGTTFHIMPVIRVDEEGRLLVVEKVQGRKTALKALVKKLSALGKDLDKQRIVICHADAPDDAALCARLARELTPIQGVDIGYLNPIIGLHTGPGTVGLFFRGIHR